MMSLISEWRNILFFDVNVNNKIMHLFWILRTSNCRRLEIKWKKKIPHCQNSYKIQSKKKTVERSKIETPNLLGTGTSIKSGGVKLVLWVQTSQNTFNKFQSLRLVCPMLQQFLDCLFLIAPSVFANVYCKKLCFKTI